MNTRRSLLGATASALAAVAALAGCVAATPRVDARHGAAVTALRAQQTLNPDAPRNMDPVQGLDGKAAKGALDNYRDSFRTPPAEASPVVSIGVGGASR